MTDPIRLMFVDDHLMYRDGVVALLRDCEGFDVVDVADDEVEAVGKAAQHLPEVILMDLQMPKMNGIEATRQIVGASPGIKILVLTMMEDDDSVFAALRAGADGYLLKDSELDEVLRAVKHVYDGGVIFGPRIAARAKSFLQAQAPRPAA